VSRVPVLVLGGGLAGLAAARSLERRAGSRATVLEREARPGGLVRTHKVGDGWFDHVLHLLHVADPKVEAFLAALDGLHLAPCPPRAFIDTPLGSARFPIQLHVGDLGPDVAARIAAEIEQREALPDLDPDATDYATLLERSFGPTLRDLFFGPYNAKLWRRPTEEMVPTGQTWNLQRPTSAAVRDGAGPGSPSRGGYNARGWYPRPPADSPIRGMEVLARRMADGLADLRLDHTVLGIDLARRQVLAQAGTRRLELGWDEACFATLPLPRLAAMAPGLPHALREAAMRLPFQRIRSAALLIEGERPDLGHWRYVPDPRLCFHRLTFLHAFDPDLAPPGRWPLLAEISERGEQPPAPDSRVLEQTETDARLAGILGPADRIVARAVFPADPGYVVFEPGVADVVEATSEAFAQAGITLGGRYGSWEYGSMASAIAAGLAFAERFEPACVPDPMALA